jgi:hypothetical protein
MSMKTTFKGPKAGEWGQMNTDGSTIFRFQTRAAAEAEIARCKWGSLVHLEAGEWVRV